MSIEQDSALGRVAAGHPAVVEAASLVLRAGGNAFDAAVGAGFASCVAEPALTSLAGGGFLLARTGDGDARLFDFFVDMPGRGLEQSDRDFVEINVPWGAADQAFFIGRAAAAVPGTLKGLLHVHRRLGRIDLADVVGPAIELARGGLTLNADQAKVIELLTPIMRHSDASRRLFERDGDLIRAGHHFANPDLASFLEHVVDQPESALYRGEDAASIDAAMRAGGGLITAADLDAYRVIEREPLCASYRDHTVLTNPAPSLGGGLIALTLALIEPHDLRSMAWCGPEHMTLLAGVMREIDRLRATGHLTPASLSPNARTEAAHNIRQSTRGTTHLSVADRDGNLATLTASNGEGCGHVIEGTGIMLNNMLGEEDLHPDGFHTAPVGDRVASMMAPTIILDGELPALVLGSGGSKRIRTAIPQVITDVLDFGRPLAEAINRPRIHWEEGRLHLEPGFDAPTLSALESGFPVNPWPRRSFYFGGVHAVEPRGVGAGDPRRGGSASIVIA